MHKIIGAIFILIATLISQTFSQDASMCLCINFKSTHPQDMICTRDFALVGVITSVGPSSMVDLIPITARIIRKVKGNNIGAVGSNFVFKTHWTRCGIRPQVGSMQFLIGDVIQGVNRIDWCLLNFPKTFQNWVYILTAGNNSYLRHCACKIYEEGGKSSNDLSCTIPKGKEQCYYETTICQRATGNSCVWKNNEPC